MSQHQSRYNYKINKMHKSGHYRKSETQNLGIFYFYVTFWAPKPLKNCMRRNKTDDNIEVLCLGRKNTLLLRSDLGLYAN